MAYNSNPGLAGIAGLVGAAVGGYLGYNQAAEAGLEPWQGAMILGGLGLVAASAGAFILKSLMQFAIYIILFLVAAYVFRDQIEALTGIDPVSACLNTLRSIGLPIG